MKITVQGKDYEFREKQTTIDILHATRKLKEYTKNENERDADVFNLAMLASLSVSPKLTFEFLNENPLLTFELMAGLSQVLQGIPPLQGVQ